MFLCYTYHKVYIGSLYCVFSQEVRSNPRKISESLSRNKRSREKKTDLSKSRKRERRNSEDDFIL